MSNEFLSWLADTWMGNLMRDIFWMWPFMENLHFFGLSLMFGALLMIDGRVLGLAKAIPMGPVLNLIPVAIVGFGINLITGLFFLTGDPFRYFYNLSFQWKMGLIIIAGFNALWFWFGEHAKLKALPQGADADTQAKVIAGLSLLLWIAVIILGRMIPYLE